MSKNRGSALIVVLLILAVMVIVATNMTLRYNSEFLRTANFINSIQAKWYAIGSEALVERVLHQDLKDNSKNVNLSQYWAMDEREFEVDGGTITGSIKDDFACINLNAIGNDLYLYKDENEEKINAIQETLYRLMVILQIQESDARIVADSIKDYIDTNIQTESYGAEDSYYRGLRYPFVIPNGSIYDISEIRQVRGMTPSIYRRLEPFICALDNSEFKLNINTIDTLKIPLLAAIFLNDSVSLYDVQDIINSRDHDGWNSITDFLKDERVKNLMTNQVGKNFVNSIVVVKSNYFRATAKVEYNDYKLTFYSFFKRISDSNYVELYKRIYGGVE